MPEKKSDIPLTVTKIAQFCHVSHRTVLIWIQGGDLKAYQTPGGHYRVLGQECIRFLRQYHMPIPAELDRSAKKKRILIVDDDSNMVHAFIRLLRLEPGYDVQSAYDGFDAGMKLMDFQPDLVILDIRMPGLDGYEVAKRIKACPRGENIKIIAVSAFFREDGREKIQKLGGDACFDKPFSVQDLIAKVKELLAGETVDCLEDRAIRRCTE